MTPPKKSQAAYEEQPKLKGWAYKTLVMHCRNLSEVNACEAEVNKLGSDGWELVAVHALSDTYILYHFKMQALYDPK